MHVPCLGINKDKAKQNFKKDDPPPQKITG